MMFVEEPSEKDLKAIEKNFSSDRDKITIFPLSPPNPQPVHIPKMIHPRLFNDIGKHYNTVLKFKKKKKHVIVFTV